MEITPKFKKKLYISACILFLVYSSICLINYHTDTFISNEEVAGICENACFPHQVQSYSKQAFYPGFLCTCERFKYQSFNFSVGLY